MSGRPDQPVIIGVGSSTVERSSDRSNLAFALDAAIAAIADAGLSRDDIDGYVGAPSATNAGALHVDGADELSMRLLAGSLGLERLRWGVDLHWDFVTGMVVAAGHALASDACENVLIVRALHHLPGISYGAAQRERAYGQDQFTAPFGYQTAGARFAMRMRAYIAASGATRDDFYEIVRLARTNAALNPLAVWRDRGATLEDYFAAPMIATPLCRLDCDMPVCGAVAFVVTRAARAAAAPHRPVFVAGAGNWQCPERVFEASGRARSDVQLCQIYDGFSSMVFDGLEQLGLCARHQAWKFIRDGQGDRGGALPVNTFGGSLGEGRLHGAGHLREAVLQLSGRAGPRQIAHAENCLVQVGPFDFSSTLMLSNVPG